MKERLQKILATHGIASRRKAEDLIKAGKVFVNGEKITKMGTQADPEKDDIRVSGKKLKVQAPRYLILHKPRGYVTTLSDEEGRPCVGDLIKRYKTRLYPVGRLDINSEGLLILTNDGWITNRLLKPSSRIERKYLAKIKGQITAENVARLRRGIRLSDGRTSPARVHVVKNTKTNSWVEIVLTEGKNRQVRRMFQAVGHPVVKLKRIRIAFLTLKNLPLGRARYLTRSEIDKLRSYVSRRPD